MSDHANTIRAGILAPDGAPDGAVAHEALAALDVLVAENQQLRDALASEITVLDGYVAGCCGDEHRFCENYGCSTIREIAGVLRAALAGTSSEDTE